MISPEGEIVELKKGINTAGAVENWLSNLEAEMRITLKDLIKKTRNNYDSSIET